MRDDVDSDGDGDEDDEDCTNNKQEKPPRHHSHDDYKRLLPLVKLVPNNP